MKEVRYLPALLSNMTRMFCMNSNEDFANKYPNIYQNPRFFNEGGSPHFPHILLSAPNTKGEFSAKKNPNGYDNLYDLMGIDRDVDIFIDSGGYSLMTGALKEKDWNNELAFNFSVKNGTVFPILDRPVTPGVDFDANLKISLESAQYYKSRKSEAEDKMILNVAQGRNNEEMKRWVDTIGQVELDGWAFGGSMHGGDNKEIMIDIFHMLKEGYLDNTKYLHIFGVSSASNIMYFHALQQIFKRHHPNKKFIFSYDSTSPFMSFLNGTIFYSYDVEKITKLPLTNRYEGWKNAAEELKMPCDCLHCDAIADLSSMTSDNTEYYLWGYLHNLTVQKKFIDINAKLVDLCYNIDGFMKGSMPPKTYKNLQVLEEAFSDMQNGEEILRRSFVGKNKKFKSDFNTLDAFME